MTYWRNRVMVQQGGVQSSASGEEQAHAPGRDGADQGGSSLAEK